jgi:hypothetical protein
MQKFAVRQDSTEFVVVCLDKQDKIVYRTDSQEDAIDWIMCTEYENSLAIYNEFG